jgi:hypothetical protein
LQPASGFKPVRSRDTPEKAAFRKTDLASAANVLTDWFLVVDVPHSLCAEARLITFEQDGAPRIEVLERLAPVLGYVTSVDVDSHRALAVSAGGACLSAA